jgi:Concanavalin A-like lectin/glucanases superfamily
MSPRRPIASMPGGQRARTALVAGLHAIVTGCSGSAFVPGETSGSAGGSSSTGGQSGGGGTSGSSGASGSGGIAGSAGASGNGGASGAGGTGGIGGSGGSGEKPDAGFGGASGTAEAGPRDAAPEAAAEASVACPPLLHYWPANGNALDVVGQNNGQLLGATFAAGKSDQAFVFNGTSAVNAARAPALRNDGDWSYSLWVLVASYTNGTMPSSDGSYFLDRTVEMSNVASLKAIGGAFGFQINYDDGGSGGGPIGGTFVTNSGTHVAMVRRAATQFALYVGGHLAGTAPDSGKPLTLPVPRFGRHATGAGFTGQIDEVRFYAGALGLAQVQALAAGIDCR